MTDESLHEVLCLLEIALGVLTALALLFISAPYGRHVRGGWGPTLPNRWGWVLMESPTLLVFVPLFLMGARSREVVPLVFLGLWLSHYLHRTLVYPFQLRTSGKRMPLVIALLAICFNVLNAYVIAPQLSQFGAYEIDWLFDPRFIGGVLVFAVGYVINRASDRALIQLRASGNSGYQVPRGRLFRYVSCPNYLGEIVQWLGFAILTWSLAGLAFALYTAANVGPRAITHHRWYRSTFPSYPPERKALIPFVL